MKRNAKMNPKAGYIVLPNPTNQVEKAPIPRKNDSKPEINVPGTNQAKQSMNENKVQVKTKTISAAILPRRIKDANKLKMAASIPIRNNALILAASRGHRSSVRLLIEAGADVNTRRRDGYTALMCAAENGHDDCVEVLIRAGADVNRFV